MAPLPQFCVDRRFPHLERPGGLRDIATTDGNGANNFSLLDFFDGHYPPSAGGGVQRNHQSCDVHQLRVGQAAEPNWELTLVVIEESQCVQVSDF